MRQRGESGPPHSPSSPPSAQRSRTDWLTLQRLLPYLWQYKWRVVAAIAFMVAAKLAKAVVTKSSGAGVGIITSSLNVRAILTLGHVI